MPKVPIHTPGHIRFFTYIIEFPDKDHRVFQVPFIHPLDVELKHTNWYKYDTLVYKNLMSKGEATLVDENKVKWTIKIENEKRPGAKQLTSKMNLS